VVAAVSGEVTVAEEEAEVAAVFFMGVGGAGGSVSVSVPAGWDDETLALAALALLAAETLDGGAGWTGFVSESWLAAGTACLATSVFLTAGFEAGWALATGFFTVTGSFDDLGRTFSGCLPRGNHGRPPVANPRVIPLKAA
jgi:hypothetical protein